MAAPAVTDILAAVRDRRCVPVFCSAVIIQVLTAGGGGAGGYLVAHYGGLGGAGVVIVQTFDANGVGTWTKYTASASIQLGLVGSVKVWAVGGGGGGASVAAADSTSGGGGGAGGLVYKYFT